jgi:broad specificity phosphatase PhoE
MPPPLPLQLKHKYYLLRHGQSEGNVEGVISSCRSLKYSTKHGLTPLGYQQGYDSAKSLLDLIQTSQQPQDDRGRNPTRVFFYSSPFARAKQTAQACLDGLLTLANQDQDQEGITTTATFDTGRNNTVLHLQDKMLDIQTDIILKDGLMERYFGQLDGLPLSTYAYVWPEDKKDVTFTGRFHVESVAAVATRLRQVILEIEQSDLHKVNHDHQREDVIVLTSHADVLQILQLYASGKDNVGEFSSYRFGNGEVRFMGRTPDTLPEPCPLEVPTGLPVL